ncbi:AzlC family ABC transporter permease [Pseudomonas stutzeri]|uniref:Branched-chain amino acid permease n=1 Tax=Stutzerimonas stutzeri TaxID=316 RepID=A0A2N8S0T6_STUST|nr:AzlC family ABC transporter permease [Stutzerimonas stutzeri]MCQ4295167.1 AzlC family ABC transporter permease [Stutzerimonas stutzeri]PNF80245.1 branched-chain amino acid permease [Stutzerimonas stutzeri]
MPAALSVMPVSMLFGVLASRSDWSMLEVLFVGLLGFTGSGQFAALPLSESGAGFLTLVLVTASINSRYLPMALTTIERLPRPAFKRAFCAHMLGDEAYASERDDEPPAAVLQIRLVVFFAWVLAGALGALLGGALPENWLSADINLGFPASAVLLYLAVSQLRTRIGLLNRARLIAIAAVALCAAGVSGLILLLGPVYFWAPGVLMATWLLGRVRP